MNLYITEHKLFKSVAVNKQSCGPEGTQPQTNDVILCVFGSQLPWCGQWGWRARRTLSALKQVQHLTDDGNAHFCALVCRPDAVLCFR